LINLAEISKDLREEIEQIAFPKAAVISSEGKGVKITDLG
jgi:hypothetical protein